MTVLTEIPLEFERYLRDKTLQKLPTNLNEFIFAYIPNLDLSVDIDRNSTIPNESLIVHKAPVASVGKTGENAIVYSAIIDSTVNEFTFNAIYLHDKNEGNSCGMIIHQQDETKQQAMTITKSALMQYDSAAASANVTIDAETWQVDISDLFAACSKVGHTHTLAEVGGSNQNLLLNGDFRINQKREVAGWICDGWRVSVGDAVGNIVSDSHEVDPSKTADRRILEHIGQISKSLSVTYSHLTISQKMHYTACLIGKKVTMSGVVRILTATGYCTPSMLRQYLLKATLRMPDKNGAFKINADTPASGWEIWSDTSNASYLHFKFTIDVPNQNIPDLASSEIMLSTHPHKRDWTVFECGKFKLERGTVATDFVSDDHATSMSNCQRRYQKITWDHRELHASTDQQLVLTFQLPTRMRAIPAMSIAAGHGEVVGVDTVASASSFTLRVRPESHLGWGAWSSGTVILDAEI